MNIIPGMVFPTGQKLPLEQYTHVDQKNVLYLSSTEDMDDVKHYFKEDESIQAFVFPKYYQVYKRKISSSMVKAMYYLCKWHQINGIKSWCKLSDYISQFKEPVVVCSGDNPKLRHWGLIEMKSETYGDIRVDGSNRTGYFRLTEKGLSFLRGEIAVEEFLYVCNKEVIGKSKTSVFVDKCVKNKFNFQDIFNK